MNDGSTDESLSVLMEYQSNDERILVFHSPENQGLSLARNVALDNAKGEYVCCVDSDDWIEADEFEKTYAYAKKYDLDMLFFDAVPFYENKDLEETYASFKSYYTTKVDLSFPRTGQQMLLDTLRLHAYRTSMCLQLLKREYLSCHNLRFYPHIFYEDTLLMFQCLLKSGICARISEAYYHRRVREGSIVTKRKGYFHIHSHATVCWEMIRALSQAKLERGKERAFLIPIRSVAYAMRKAYDALDENERKEFLEQYLTPLEALRFQILQGI